MAGFFKNIASNIGDIVNVAHAIISPFKVQAVNAERFREYRIVQKDGCVCLYGKSSTFECVVFRPDAPNKMMSVFRQNNQTETNILYKYLIQVLAPLLSTGEFSFQEETLQQLWDCIREHPSWTAAHVAAYLGYHSCLKHPGVIESYNIVKTCSMHEKVNGCCRKKIWKRFVHSIKTSRNIDNECARQMMTPLMCAIIGKQAPSCEAILKLGANLQKKDRDGNTAYHFAVLNCPPLVAMLTDYDKHGVINWLNGKGESALLLACQNKLPDATEILITGGADPRVATADCLPIHAAVKCGDHRSLESIVKHFPDQINATDFAFGGSPLHWAETTETIHKLAMLGCDMDIKNKEKLAPLHIMMHKKRPDCLMSLLCHGANCNVLDNKGESVLHAAIKQDNLELVRQFVVFGADVNQKNTYGHTPRHLASMEKSKTNFSEYILGKGTPVRETILYLLHVSGAKRCDKTTKGCLAGCVAEGSFNGTPDQTMSALKKLDSVALFDEQMMATSVHVSLNQNPEGAVLDMTDAPVCEGDRVLCLDGGGIRGLVLIQILMEIEAAVGRPIRECFDWIGGTSTGGILALGIARGFSLMYMKGLYVRLKDEVFKGKRPYDPKFFEQMLKREFGENSVMADIDHPKVLISAVLADRFPADFHFFRNFQQTLSHPRSSPGNIEEMCAHPKDQKIWEAARSSGAAPTYFKSWGPYVDGGLICNNPTLDVLTEIHEYNMGLRLMGKASEARPIGCVISLGCGRIPTTPVDGADVFFPTGISDVYKAVTGASALGKIIVDQATVSEGRPVDRARAWCSMMNTPFYRFSPLLSEDISLDCHEEQSLIKMIWETHCYMVANRHRVQELTSLLQQRPGNFKI